MRYVLGMCAVLAAMPLAAQPVINTSGAVSAASYSPVGLPNSAIAQGSVFIVFGKNLGPASIVSASYPLSSTLAGTSAAVTVNGTTVSPPVIYTVAGQVALLMPSSTPTGSGTIAITYSGQTSPPVAVQVTAANFGILTVNQGGSGPAVVTDANYVVITPTHAATPGQSLIAWGTGLGKIAADETQPPPQGNVGTKPTVWMGSQQAGVQYWGRSGCCAGLDQINFQVPAGTTGCYVPVAVQTGGTVSNFGSIAVAASGSVCSDPVGLTSAQLAPVQNGQNLNVATLALSRSIVSLNLSPPATSTTTTSDSGSASFLRYTPAQLDATSFGQTVSVGGCMVYPINATATVSDPVQPLGLDAGANIPVGGTNGTVQLPPVLSNKGYYYEALGSSPTSPLFLDVSGHTMNVFGGSDVGDFAAEVSMPPALAWSNRSGITTVSESQGVTVNWTNAVSGGYVTVTGYSFSLGQSGSLGAGARFYCTAPAGSNGAGQFSIPSYVLQSLPVTAAGASTPSGFLGISTQTTAGEIGVVRGIDVASAHGVLQLLQNVTYTQ